MTTELSPRILILGPGILPSADQAIGRSGGPWRFSNTLRLEWDVLSSECLELCRKMLKGLVSIKVGKFEIPIYIIQLVYNALEPTFMPVPLGCQRHRRGCLRHNIKYVVKGYCTVYRRCLLKCDAYVDC